MISFRVDIGKVYLDANLLSGPICGVLWLGTGAIWGY